MSTFGSLVARQIHTITLLPPCFTICRVFFSTASSVLHQSFEMYTFQTFPVLSHQATQYFVDRQDVFILFYLFNYFSLFCEMWDRHYVFHTLFQECDFYQVCFLLLNHEHRHLASEACTASGVVLDSFMSFWMSQQYDLGVIMVGQQLKARLNIV